ncbi:hypothetical protein [uncultured Pontibacter sp.]|uniref:hypothetical protein n=1 Tax=uncultured Pontibacter sp. TaxID=453356 RepID=UPI00260F2867|nr:hypothetical protein [uncultured Pontibacter sp.]
MKTSKSAGLGIMFCLAQSIGESVLAYWFITLKGTSDINFEGMMLYSFIRIVLTVIPYMLLFMLTYKIRKTFVMPALVALSINVLVLITLYLFDIYQKERLAIMFSSLLLSNIFLVTNKLINRKTIIVVN